MPPRGRPWQGFGQGPGEGQENAGQGRRPRAPSVVVRKAPKKAPALVVRKAEKAKKAPAPKKVPKKASKMIRSAPAAPKPRGRPKKVPPRAVLEPEVGEVEEDEVTEGAPAPAPAKRPAPAPSPAAPPAKRPTGASGGGALAGWRGAGEGGGAGGGGTAEAPVPAPTYRDAVYGGARPVAVEAPPAAAGVRTGGGASDSQGFYQLRANYRDLEQKYKDLKVAKIAQVKALLEEQSENLAQQGEASKKLVEVWRSEAERQAGLVRELTAAQAQSAGVDAEAHRSLEAEAERLREKAQRSSGSMEYLLGLQTESLPGGGYQYRHPGTGFTFQVVPAASVFDEDDDGFAEDDVAYVPMQLGTMCDSLPDFLREEIAIDAQQRGKLISNLLKHLPC